MSDALEIGSEMEMKQGGEIVVHDRRGLRHPDGPQRK